MRDFICRHLLDARPTAGQASATFRRTAGTDL